MRQITAIWAFILLVVVFIGSIFILISNFIRKIRKKDEKKVIIKINNDVVTNETYVCYYKLITMIKL